ncbi:hypothetical protein F2Q68_00038174 [Brassica cretica]|uniref:Uncharacterized protein n=1 Tax=Brassica cretica TaxID=69181 RepID=A0A8S9MLP0_BRACR|nr:hypothetical protein F2Q68_00038174 [Brassica cretica]
MFTFRFEERHTERGPSLSRRSTERDAQCFIVDDISRKTDGEAKERRRDGKAKERRRSGKAKRRRRRRGGEAKERRRVDTCRRLIHREER